MKSEVSEQLDVFRTGKAYTAGQAAWLSGTTPSTVRRWLQGYVQPGHQMSPLFGERQGSGEGQNLTVSFIELVEIVVAARFRRGNVDHRPLKLERLRRAHRFAREQLGVPYPFASLKLLESGGHLMHQFDLTEPGAGTLALDLNGQWVLPGLVRNEMEHNLDFDGQFAERWFPRGRGGSLVVDPHRGGGRLTIVNRGVTVDTLNQRWKAGEPIDSLAQDYELDPAVVEEALQYAA